ncbi:glycoside hydrolase family 3 protein [Maricaulis maris]|uniref:beta-N-acetylhexosaminidase n=1 Tax=Maricaulis maris TaxID=74318 RepID=A0A495DM41_9PROT|nr:glycoside hydrolase family 3 N-terminal domain-containing protein [Maricaulis maris]RKR03974.1 beta-N-acetylhexosaminidase [Maricaulis maris]
MDRRRVLQSGLAATLMAAAGPAARASLLDAVAERSLAERVGEMLLLGFIGSHAQTEGADIIDAHLSEKRIGGVLFLRHNARTREGAEGSAARFRATRPDAWMAIDQEGGLVQRLSRDMGYTWIPRAMQVVEERGLSGARELYAIGGRELKAAGFNMNLAPVADVHDAENAVIGRHGRAYGTDGETIAAYAGAFIDAFEASGVACAIKHFPGHGRSRGDSHDGFVDISESWSEAELAPFRELINDGKAHLMMGGHLTNRQLDPSGVPVTFSAPVLEDLLRGQLGFDGVVMTDDLDMGAIRDNYDQREAVISAIEAGNDMIMLSNSAAPDPELPQRIVDWVVAAISDGRLTEARINQSVARLAVLKARVGL